MNAFKKTTHSIRALLALAVLLTAAAPVRAQFNTITNNGGIVITGYSGPGGTVVIPATITGLPVVSIGSNAFYAKSSITFVALPPTVLSIQTTAFQFCVNLAGISMQPGLTNVDLDSFQGCVSLTNLTLPGTVISVGSSAFLDCFALRSVTLSASLTNLGNSVFYNCYDLGSIAIPRGVNSVGVTAFQSCSALTNICFFGNAPTVSTGAFQSDTISTVYYTSNTTGWSNTFQGIPTVLWNPQIQTNAAVNNGTFKLTVTGTPGIPVLLQGAGSLSGFGWTPLASVILTNGSYSYSEPVQSSSGRFFSVVFP